MTQLTKEDKAKALNIWSRMSDLMRAHVLMDIEHRERRRNCCEPYDCMCHEMCGEFGYCGGCKYGMELTRITSSVSPLVWRLADEMHLENQRQVVTYELQTMKDLESVGDYAAAQRIWEGA